MNSPAHRESALAATFIDELSSRGPAELATPELEEQLCELLGRARAAWPQLPVSSERFVRYLAARLPVEQSVDAALRTLDVEGLYLASACSEGDEDAIKTLESVYAPQIGKALARLSGSDIAPEDFLQILRRKLYVGDESSRPGIVQFSGTGPLAAWLRVTAVRVALNLIRDHGRHHASLEEADARLPEVLIDPELEHLKSTYRQAFREAFVEAVAGLAPRDRVLLRQAVVEGLTVRQIGTIYGVHHTTTARWIGKARSTLTELTKQALRRRLEIGAGELDSILGLIQSRFDVSIIGVLQRAGDDEAEAS